MLTLTVAEIHKILTLNQPHVFTLIHQDQKFFLDQFPAELCNEYAHSFSVSLGTS